MMQELLRGISIQFNSSGRSLEPLVFSGDTCFLDPIHSGCNSHEIQAGDIVFCHVQPNWRYYTHLVWRVTDYETEHGIKKRVYIIGNNYSGSKKKYNGWCHREHLYGILVSTSAGRFEPIRDEKFESPRVA